MPNENENEAGNDEGKGTSFSSSGGGGGVEPDLVTVRDSEGNKLFEFTTSALACSSIKQKCIIRDKLATNVYDLRNTTEFQSLGHFGPVEFEPLQTFLERTVKEKCTTTTTHPKDEVVSKKRKGKGKGGRGGRGSSKKSKKEKKEKVYSSKTLDAKTSELTRETIDLLYAKSKKKKKHEKVRLKPQVVQFKTKKGQKVVSIGDIHGDFLVWLTCLYMTGVMSADGEWIGGNTIVVQEGDIFDRHGRGSSTVDTAHNPREEIDILQHIHGMNVAARKQNGKVISIVGNHEADKFSSVSNALRESGVRGRHAANFDIEENANLTKITKYEGELHVQGWGGVVEKRKMFLPGSLLACYFVIYKPVILQINDWLFCHGGVKPREGGGEGGGEAGKGKKKQKPRSVEGLNREWRKYLLGFLSQLSDDVEDLYYDRTYGAPEPTPANNESCARSIQSIFKEFKLNPSRAAIVVGHTVQRDGIKLYCKGKVWRTDNGMSEAFGNDGSVQFIVTDFDTDPIQVKIIKAMHSKDKETGMEQVDIQIETYAGTDLIEVEKTTGTVRISSNSGKSSGGKSKKKG